MSARNKRATKGLKGNQTQHRVKHVGSSRSSHTLQSLLNALSASCRLCKQFFDPPAK